MAIGKTFNEEYRITRLSTLRHFITGGRGQLDLVAPSGTYHTYVIKAPQSYKKFPKDVRFVYILHEGKEYYLGVFTKFAFRITANSRYKATDDVAKGAEWLSAMCCELQGNKLRISKMRVYSYGRCARCGRPLTSEWVHVGVGPKCNKKLIKEAADFYYVGERP